MMCTIIFNVGASIHACCRSGRHLLAFEIDLAIFDIILVPLCDSLSPLIVHGLQLIKMVCEDNDKPIWKVPRKFYLSA